jgi:hypothetical protein
MCDDVLGRSAAFLPHLSRRLRPAVVISRLEIVFRLRLIVCLSRRHRVRVGKDRDISRRIEVTIAAKRVFSELGQANLSTTS